jgi:guanylate kinase
MENNGKLFIITAPSGAGKTSVTKAVILKLKNILPIEKVITYTTRQPRPGEVSGVDYHFISTQDFFKKQAEGFFLETTNYANNFYGSPSSIIKDLKNGKSFIVVTDMAGAKNFKNNIMPGAVSIWITVSDPKELCSRLEKRGDPKALIEKRLKLALEEMAQEAAQQNFDYHVKNDDFDRAVNEVIRIIKQNLIFA